MRSRHPGDAVRGVRACRTADGKYESVAQPHAPNLGVHLANRLVEIGCTTAFGVVRPELCIRTLDVLLQSDAVCKDHYLVPCACLQPGDFNLLLLDQLLKHPKLDTVRGTHCSLLTNCTGRIA